ncbi:MAG: flagellar basal body rod protein FlgC [Alphaproteobacteria bacterium]|nr:flagellar basal body rod protein FlgC [Alphaproteobacteria bacterium]
MDPLLSASQTAASALKAQSMRLRVISENLANAESTGITPGADPYRRKLVTFEAELDHIDGAPSVRVGKIIRDDKPFRLDFRPGHPAANAEGYVKLPNVNTIVEMADLREAGRSYEANLQVIRQAREMVSMTIDLLRSQP